jgi:uncharacterized protein (TIGR02284 family)
MTMTTDKIIEECNELIRMDRDAIGAYQEAIEKIEHPDMAQQLERFKGDHQRHVNELTAIVGRLSGTPAKKPDLKGAARKTMTKIAGLLGVEPVLMAMRSNEKALNETYERHSKMDFPADILDVIRRNYQDEQRHLAWVEDCLRTRPWEHKPAHP